MSSVYIGTYLKILSRIFSIVQTIELINMREKIRVIKILLGFESLAGNMICHTMQLTYRGEGNQVKGTIYIYTKEKRAMEKYLRSCLRKSRSREKRDK